MLDKGSENPFYLESLTGSLKARFFRITSGLVADRTEYTDLETEYLETLEKFGYNPRTIFLMRDLAHLQAFYLEKIDESIDVLDRAVSMAGVNPNVNAECKLELGDILLYRGDIWDASLLYSQVDKALKNEPIGSEAKLRNARLSYYIGEFGWAKAQLDVLKAATSKLIANDALELSLLIMDNMDLDSTYRGLSYYARADMLSFMNRDEEALTVLDSIKMLGLYHSLDDEVLFRKAEIFTKMGKYEESDSLLAKVISDYPYDILADNALFKRAELQEYAFSNDELAMELYQTILTDYSGSLFVTEARKRFRNLRGDRPPDGNSGKTLIP
jgi:tetratricopeptide (TPR) repeat protein